MEMRGRNPVTSRALEGNNRIACDLSSMSRTSARVIHGAKTYGLGPSRFGGWPPGVTAPLFTTMEPCLFAGVKKVSINRGEGTFSKRPEAHRLRPHRVRLLLLHPASPSRTTRGKVMRDHFLKEDRHYAG